MPQGTRTGYYLALTFGTLLSSQGADAQKLDPRGLRRWLEVQLYAGFQNLPAGGSGPAALPGRAAQGPRPMVYGSPCAARTGRSAGPGAPAGGLETGVVLDIQPGTKPGRVEFLRVRSLRTQQRAESQCQVIPRAAGLRIRGWDSFG